MKRRAFAVRVVLIVATAMIGSCGKEKVTALDLRLDVTGTIDQVRIDAVTVAGAPVLLANDERLFPASPRLLKDGDVLTLWFADSADMQTVTVTATGRLCGKDATAQVMTAPQTLSKSATVTATLALTNNDTACTGDGGAGMGGGGAGGASGAGGGTAGNAGTAGTGGATGGGSAGTGGTGVAGSAGGAGRGGAGGTAGGTAGSAGTGGAAGRGGTGGTTGTGGAAGRGGTTGTAGTTGAAGRGGTTGTAGTTGAAGRGGTTGTAGASGRGGGGGTGGARICTTTPVAALAQPLGTQAPTNPTTCGYPVLVPQGIQYSWTGGDVFALVSAAVYGNSGNCGRCVELVRTSPSQTRRATVTIVGSCNDPVCVALPNDARFQLSLGAYNMLAQPVETSLPLAGETLTYSFVACPVPVAPDGQPERIRANFMIQGGGVSAVLFVGQRFGIASATAAPAGGASQPLSRGNDNYWRPPNGMSFAGSASFVLTDTNLANVSFNHDLTNPAPFQQTTAQFATCP